MYENAGTENKPGTDVEQKSDMFLNVESLYKCHLGRAMTSTVISVRQRDKTARPGVAPRRACKPERSIFQTPFLQAALKHMQWDVQCAGGHVTFVQSKTLKRI